MNKNHVYLSRSDETTLHIYVTKPIHQKRSEVIIFVHGFLGEALENHRMFLRMSDVLNQAGFTCVLYDQKGCGYSSGDYAEVTLSNIQEDLYTVTKWVKDNIGNKIGFIGQSVGSALILSMQETTKPQFLIAINPASNFNEWLTSRYNWDLSNGQLFYYAFPKGILVSRSFIEDLLGWDWVHYLQPSSIQTLVLAATEDDINSVKTAYAIIDKLGNEHTIQLIEGANHSFTGQRDLEEKAINIIIRWLHQIK